MHCPSTDLQAKRPHQPHPQHGTMARMTAPVMCIPLQVSQLSPGMFPPWQSLSDANAPFPREDPPSWSLLDTNSFMGRFCGVVTGSVPKISRN